MITGAAERRRKVEEEKKPGCPLAREYHVRRELRASECMKMEAQSSTPH